jgi:TolB-like protein/class 3 adenylate cyclase
MPPVRRLTAILAADVAGCSRLMADEEGTHERLKAHLRELLNPKITEHRGRIVKNTGDGLLAEFASVVDAVRCAVEVQRGMINRQPEVPEERRIRFRIGVNLGDVIAEEHDIFGDGVNVAARLEALAEPGGICVSRVVRDQVRDKLNFVFADMGEQSVKNIARPVRVYALRPEGIAGLPTANVSSLPIAAPRLSIVVLPFTNLSDDREQQYFADGITEDLTTDLSRLANMFAISRNTAFTYRSKPIDTKQIGRELGVRYVLEGSVRRSGNQVRVNSQLIDAATDAHLWAERFDRDTGDLLALQNEITGRLANALGVELIAAEAARPAEHPDALDYILRGRAVLMKPRTPDTRREAINLFEHALALDPQSIEAQGRLAGVLVSSVLAGMADSAAADLTRAEGLVGQVLAVSPRYAFAHFVKGHVLRAQKRWEEAIPECEAALASQLSARTKQSRLVQALRRVAGRGDSARGASHPSQPPRSLHRGFLLLDWNRASAAIAHRQAIVWLEKARSAIPGIPTHRSRLAAAYALRGETERAAAELAEARRLIGGDPFLSIAHLRVHPGPWWGCRRSAPWSKPLFSPACARPGCRRSETAPTPAGSPPPRH